MPAALASLNVFKPWFDDKVGPRPGYWNTGTGSMDAMGSMTAFFPQLPAERRQQLIDYAWNTLVQSQDPQTGCWTDPLKEAGIHGLLKFSGMPRLAGKPFPRADQMAASVMRWYRHHDPVGFEQLGKERVAHDTPRLGNPIRVLALINKDRSAPITRADLAVVLRWYTKALAAHRTPDGGIARWRDRFDLTVMDKVAKPWTKPCGDVNGSGCILFVRTYGFELAGLKAPPVAGADTYWQRFAAHHGIALTTL